MIDGMSFELFLRGVEDRQPWRMKIVTFIWALEKRIASHFVRGNPHVVLSFQNHVKTNIASGAACAGMKHIIQPKSNVLQIRRFQ
jgi:hypothetical protein